MSDKDLLRSSNISAINDVANFVQAIDFAKYVGLSAVPPVHAIDSYMKNG